MLLSHLLSAYSSYGKGVKMLTLIVSLIAGMAGCSSLIFMFTVFWPDLLFCFSFIFKQKMLCQDHNMGTRDAHCYSVGYCFYAFQWTELGNLYIYSDISNSNSELHNLYLTSYVLCCISFLLHQESEIRNPDCLGFIPFYTCTYLRMTIMYTTINNCDY